MMPMFDASSESSHLKNRDLTPQFVDLQSAILCLWHECPAADFGLGGLLTQSP